MKQVAAMGHNLRFAIVLALLNRPASAAELAAALEVPASKVRYQLRQLLAAGMVEVTEEKVRRGAVERFYLANPEMTLFEDEQLEDLPPATRDRMHRQILKRGLSSAVQSLQADLAGRRQGSVFVRVPLRVDAQGWSELAKVYRDALDRTLQVGAESRLRLQESGEDPVLSFGSLFFLSLPSPEEP